MLFILLSISCFLHCPTTLQSLTRRVLNRRIIASVNKNSVRINRNSNIFENGWSNSWSILFPHSFRCRSLDSRGQLSKQHILVVYPRSTQVEVPWSKLYLLPLYYPISFFLESYRTLHSGLLSTWNCKRPGRCRYKLAAVFALYMSTWRFGISKVQSFISVPGMSSGDVHRPNHKI